MRRARYGLAALLCAAISTAGAAERSDAEVAASILRDVLDANSSDSVAEDRQSCASGLWAETTEFTRNNGLKGYPDTSDYCVTVLIRTGRDGRLLDVYEDILRRHTGATTNAEKLPAWIGGALIKQRSSSVPVGNGKGVVIEPALAFDAGFATAWLEHRTATSGMPDVVTLKAISENCLAQKETDLGLCYATGYAHAARALNGLLPTVDP